MRVDAATENRDIRDYNVVTAPLAMAVLHYMRTHVKQFKQFQKIGCKRVRYYEFEYVL